MENSLEVIENIMKPYFEKKEKLNNSNVELNSAKIRLENLLNNKEREIEEYLSSDLVKGQTFYSGYEAMIRKDLENAYKEKEELLRKEILELERNKYKNVDLREMVDLKGDLRKQLFEQQRTLKISLEEQQLLFKMTMLKLDNFKNQYNEQNQIINGDERRNLFDESNKIVDKINEIKNALKKTEQYLELTTLTSEEAAAIMRSMTPWEKEEYDRRKQAIISKTKENEKIDEQSEEEIEIPEIEIGEPEEEIEIPEMEIGELEEEIETPEIETPEEEIELPALDIPEEEIEETEIDTPEKDIEVPEVETPYSDIIEIDDPIISKYEENDGNIVVDNVRDLMKTIYNAVIAEANNLRTIKLNKSMGALEENEFYLSSKENNEEYQLNGSTKFSNDDAVKLPSGEYLYEEDINKAINNFYNRNKGINYVVKETSKNYKITKYNVEKLKRKLKKCSRVKLIKENKLSKFDLLKVFGKKRSEKMMNEINISNLKDVKVPEGEYVNREDIIINMSDLFKNNEKNWLKSFSDSLKKKQEERNRKRQEEQDYILEIDDDYIIKK